MKGPASLNRLTIIGVGLIGGSLARALRKWGSVGEIVGSGRSSSHLQRALELGVVDRYELDPAEAVKGADLVVVAVPVAATHTVLQSIAPHINKKVVVTDVGSVKGSVVSDAESALGDRFGRFVPGHPIAGVEHSGVEAAFSTLFVDRKVILTPVEGTDGDALEVVEGLWETAQARVMIMGVTEHDRILAATSHLPHLLAYLLVEHLDSQEEGETLFDLAAGGFRDFTRIASSDPTMWRDVSLTNREALAEWMESYRKRLEQVIDDVRAGRGEQLQALFTKAKRARDRYFPPDEGLE
ncbi:MAG: prephenate dehydrogenase/arogenate dehydrogenase family protein [Arenicellales bacterium]|nr:prephenate dehydrogenase/arogenate dehydrogenase family protein [Arenicellales bacterium]